MKKFLMMFLAGTFIMSITLNAQTAPAPAGGDKKAPSKSTPVRKETGNIPVKKVASKKHKDLPVKPVDKKESADKTPVKK